MLRRKGLQLALLAFLNSVCATAAAPLPPDTINPSDEENLGRLVVVAPEGAASGTPSYGRIARMSFGTESLTLGAPLRTLAATRCLTLGSSFFELQDCGVSVAAKQTTTYHLSGVLAHWDANRVAVDFGPSLSLKFRNQQKWLAENNVWPSVPSEILPVLQGSYQFAFSPERRFDGVEPVDFYVSAGEVRDLDLTPKDDIRGKLVVTFQPKVFPDVSIPCAGGGNSFVLWREPGHEADVARDGIYGPAPEDVMRRTGASPLYGIDSFRAVSAADDKGLRMIPFTDGKNAYEYVINNMLVSLSLKRGRTTQIDLKRIDVNDVKVTEEDGTVYYAHGNYSLYRPDPAKPGEWLPVRVPAVPMVNGSCYTGYSGHGWYDSFPTKTGIDLLPGTYKVVIAYSTKEGPKTQQTVVDLAH